MTEYRREWKRKRAEKKRRGREKYARTKLSGSAARGVERLREKRRDGIRRLLAPMPWVYDERSATGPSLIYAAGELVPLSIGPWTGDKRLVAKKPPR
jgi:hypothetical protein